MRMSEGAVRVRVITKFFLTVPRSVLGIFLRHSFVIQQNHTRGHAKFPDFGTWYFLS